jgi:predicted RNA-binding Zn-ribbon protein involved in translation (DUF1610 family)
MDRKICRQCAKDFGRKALDWNGHLAPASTRPPCEWREVKELAMGGRIFSLPGGRMVGVPTGWNDARVQQQVEFREGIATRLKSNSLLCMVRCPRCGCSLSRSRGKNYQCENCGHLFRKHYSPHRGRPAYSEEERRKFEVGTYRRKG